MSDYQDRIQSELAAFRDLEGVHELPPIFHYWSHKYLRPLFEAHGFSDPEDFFRGNLRRLCADPDRPEGRRLVRCLSVGAGNCDLEARLARDLTGEGFEDLRIECLDLNPAMLERGWRAAREVGVERNLVFIEGDFNRWTPIGRYDAIIANQALHHVLELEHLLDGLSRALEPHGRFLVSDMIGRNGHMRSPEALELVHTFWRELPEDYRYNSLLQRHEEVYINHDCRDGAGFEGIRSEDVLPLLQDRFRVDLCVTFGNVIDVFVDRPFGHNFDIEREWDREFIDRVHEADARALAEGRLAPTHLVAALGPLRPRGSADRDGEDSSAEDGGLRGTLGAGDPPPRSSDRVDPSDPEGSRQGCAERGIEIDGRREFERAMESTGDRFRYERVVADRLAADRGARGLPGVCRACGFAGTLELPSTEAPPNFRESLVCPSCRLNNRQRLVAHLIRGHPGRVYLQEQVTPFYAWARAHLVEVVGSEYLGAKHEPGRSVDGLRHEDVSRLSFPDGSFDVVASNDVLEHVPDVDRALGELARILRPGGLFVFTVPFHSDRDRSRRRASAVAGNIHHLERPEFHGNPLDPEGGSLVFSDFGWDLLERCRAAGFSTAAALGVWTALYGHIGGGLQLVFRAVR